MHVWPSWPHQHPCLEGVQQRSSPGEPAIKSTIQFHGPLAASEDRAFPAGRMWLCQPPGLLELSLVQRVLPVRALPTSDVIVLPHPHGLTWKRLLGSAFF